MIPLKWVVAVVAVTVGTLLAPVASEVPSTCDWLIPSESGCVESAECKDSGDAINVYEDCEVGMELFTINDTTVAFDGDCSFANGKTKITLKQKLDAEDPNSKSCKVVGRSTLYFRAVNINEFPPETTKDTVPVTEVHVNENLNSFEGPSIYYKDDDYGETESLSCKLISGDEHLFSLKPVDDGNVNIKTFTFSVNGKLDYESKVFYRVEYEIISTDKKNNKLSATQIFFIYVEDMPDNSPFFTKIVPVYNLEECMIEDSLFEVTAQDRDVDVMYDIKYSMDVAGGGEYFGINENTGEVSKNGVIDREELLSIGISTFSLTITATEHKKDGTPGEMPNNATQVTTVIIQDCNDNFPEFNNVSYAIEMYELTQDSGNKELDLEIVVSDMDEGINGSFKLTTSNPEQLSIDPENVKQSANVILTAHWISSKDNPFDYENYQDPLEFTITATEDANKTHTNTVNVTITLRDVNDCLPVFSQSSYTVNVPETTNVDSVLLTVVAEDNDVTEDYGTPSISYSLESSCYYKFGINNASGDVTLKNELDYDGDSGDKKIHCKVFARDSYGSGLATSSEITITVIDEVDYPPIIEDKDIGMTIKENSKKKEVGRFNVIDLDSDANIEFNITSSICSGDVATQGDISGWFDVFAGEPNHSEYPGIVTVNNPPDREICNEVTLTIMAVDKNTIKDTDNVNGTVVIEITDEKDELPLFVGDYVNLNIDEFDELQNPPPPDKVYIFTLKVMDPDESDTINLDVSKGGDKVELVPTTVTVAQGEEAEVEVRTKQYSNINREEDPTIEIEISLTNPTNSKAARKRKFSIKINDLNDKIPTIDSDLTSRNYSLKEDDGTESINNSIIFTLTAKDEDSESPYNIVSYYLMNIDNPNSKDQRTPFMVNATTGKVSVFLTEEKTLDRERDQTWELNFLARDQCKGNGQDADCEVLSSELYKVFITVEDVNDNQPRGLTWTPNHNPLIVDDFLKNHTELKYILEATDDDIGTNADLTYEVLGTFSFKDGENKDLFDAQSDNNICRLYSKTNFEGKMLTGWYYLTIRATDGGGLSTDFNVTLEVVDGNDQAPQFSLSGCAGEEADNIIKMEEGDYLPGVDGNPTPMLVNCLKPNGLPFTITMTDADTDVDNRRMEVKIDLANSTVENAEHGNAEEQLKYWSLEPKTCPSNCEVQLMLSHEIDHEKGTAYNLSLYARNTEQPLQETWSMVRVVVTNRREYEPYFCTEANCTYIVYIPENEPKAEAYFMEATDMDNINTGEGDDPVEQVFYFITGGDTNYFDTYSNMQNKIILKNLPNGLDREDPDKSSYSLDILATNDPSGSTQPGNSSSILHLIIRVLDKNDVFPVFKDVIFTSFMETDTIEKRLTVIEAEDLDLNETLTYTILDDIQWHDTVVPPPVTSFTIERKDSRSCYLKLDFDPKAVTQGYCNFTIHVEDAGGHTDKAQVKVYSINDDYKVSMYFSNDVAYVKETENEIEAAYTDAYGYSCVIDSITTTQTSSGDPVANETTVYMHFIDDEKNKPVAKETILQLSNNADVMRKLSQELKLHGIILDSVGQYFPPEGGKSPEDQILTLKILLAVVTLVLGCLLVLLITVSCIRTRSLKRKVHVLSTNTFGSKESGLNHLGHDVVPGSNLAQVHGNHNPVFSENDDFEMKIRDTGSISSGDSDLIGVEDNPEFKSYSNKGAQDSSSKGYENSSFGRSIDQVSAPVPGVQGGVKGNPLLNFGALQDSPMPSNNSLEREVFGDHEESASDTASLDQKINSNFSFS